MPQRIQRKRTKGWRMPKGAIYVGRPTKWGNPFQIIDIVEAFDGDVEAARRDCVGSFRHAIDYDDGLLDFTSGDLVELRGKDLACWCPLDQPCHADVLLELANDDAVADLGPQER